MASKVFLFTQAGCLSCELMKLFLEAKDVAFEERDMSSDAAARIELLEIYHSSTAPTLVILTPAGAEVIEGFEPDRLDRVLDAA